MTIPYCLFVKERLWEEEKELIALAQHQRHTEEGDFDMEREFNYLLLFNIIHTLTFWDERLKAIGRNRIL